MIQLLTHIIFLIILHREHKSFYSEWNSFFVFLSLWIIIFVASVSYLAGDVIERWYCFEVGTRIFILLYVTPFFIVYTYYLGLLISTFYGDYAECFLTWKYTYFNYLIGFGFQCVYYKKLLSSYIYYLIWYRYQCGRVVVKVLFIPASILFIIVLFTYIYAFFHACLMQHYISYLVMLYYMFIDLCFLIFIGYLVIYILLKLLVAIVFINWLFINKNTRFIGSWHLDDTYEKKRRINDFSYRLESRNYIENVSILFLGRNVYAYPLNWLTINQFQIDSYHTFIRYFRFGYIYILLIYIYKRYDRLDFRSRRREEVYMGYDMIHLDQELMYG